MKKSILCTTLSIFCLFGCNRTKIKEVKKSEAESFVKETYTLENAKSKYDPDTTKTVEDITKVEGIFDALGYKVEKTEKTEPMESLDDKLVTVDFFKDVPDNASKFIIDGTSMTIEADLTISAVFNMLAPELGMQGVEIKVDGTVLSITSNSMTLVFETGGSDVSIKASVNEVGLTTLQEIKLNLNLKSVATSALSVSGVLQGVFSRSFTYKAK